MATFIDFHALQTLPPSNINRGEDGAPKTAAFGGTRRQRISSQALKAAQRRDFAHMLNRDELGVRTKQIVAETAARVCAADPEISPAEAEKWSSAAFGKAGIKVAKPKAKKDEDPKPEQAGYLVFLGNHQLDRLAAAIVEKRDQAFTKKEVLEIIDTEHAVDVSLFGRMIADDAALNVDAAVQTAHAIGVSEAAPDFDFYTAVDDFTKAEEETGAGMMGTIEMMSSTFYRYATLNVDQLLENLGSEEALVRAIDAYARTFILSLPTGYQNTFAAHTLPDLVNVAVRKRPVSYVNAFEKAVAPDERGTIAAASEAMADEASKVTELYGLAPERSWLIASDALEADVDSLGQKTGFAELVSQLEDQVRSLLNEDER